jgi:hypothetical protein
MKASPAPVFPNTLLHFSLFSRFISANTLYFSCCSVQSQRPPGDTVDGRYAASQGPAQAAQEV